MKRLLDLVLLPIVLFALEKVNLIKDGGFEKDSGVWQGYAKTRSGEEIDSNAVDSQDETRSYSGFYSASCDTRNTPLSYEVDSAVVLQGFSYPKEVADLDSLTLAYSIMPITQNTDLYYDWLHTVLIALHIDAGKPTYWFAGYTLKALDLNPTPQPPIKSLGISDFPEDTLWHLLSENIKNDLVLSDISEDASVDSFKLVSWGAYFPPWRGQKIYWDAIRLTGYADYDVGLKEILSGDSLDKDTPYTPVARIKNFGRENAPEFSVIAEIFEGTTRVYYDSLPWSLTSDTEDTVTFVAFTPSSAANHTLAVRTSMSPDESDEDDELSKTLFGSGIEEPVTQPSSLQLDIVALSSIRYSIPSGEQGTITLYDPSGRRIESLTVRGTGQVNLRWGLASGVYFIKLEMGKVNVTRKAVILR